MSRKVAANERARLPFLRVFVFKDIDLRLMLMDKSFQHFDKFCYNSQHS